MVRLDDVQYEKLKKLSEKRIGESKPFRIAELTREAVEIGISVLEKDSK